MVGSVFLESGRTLARRIKAGELTSRDLVEQHIARIERVNSTLNAVVWKRYQEALEEATTVDASVAKGDADRLGPYAGVPCTVKECFAFRGKPQTSGLVARRDRVARQDATVITRMRDAGMIPLGGTNVSELCMWMESDNRVYGRTNNPYDPSRIVGGSSGGEGAIIGAGASPFGLGSDVGGSIRMPAFFNGVFGHKPSGGMVPNSGQFPMPENEVLLYCTTGPLSRRAEDLYPLLRLMAGPDAEDTLCRAFRLGDPADVDISKLRVIDIPDNGVIDVHPELRQAQIRARDALARQGAKVETRHFPELAHSVGIWSTMLQAAGGKSFSDMLFQGRSTSLVREWWRLLVGRSPHTLPALVLAAAERIGPRAPKAAQSALKLGRQLRQALDDALGDDGVLLYPSYAEPAPLHRKPVWPPLTVRRSGVDRQLAVSTDWAYTAILNVMQLPATQVPMGLGADGLPLGVQVGTAYGQDHRSIAVAQFLEEEFGGWVPPWEAGPHATR